MTVKYSKFISICGNCNTSGEGYRYIRIGIKAIVICPSCADLLARQLRSMSDESNKQMER